MRYIVQDISGQYDMANTIENYSRGSNGVACYALHKVAQDYYFIFIYFVFYANYLSILYVHFSFPLFQSD